MLIMSQSVAERLRRLEQELATATAMAAAVGAENARLRSDLEWMKHRLNQVEMERAMLIQDRIGVKISVPEFKPAIDHSDVEEAFQRAPDLSRVGSDAADEPDLDPKVDYSMMPGRSRR